MLTLKLEVILNMNISKPVKDKSLKFPLIFVTLEMNRDL